jgi:hypothetical protein
MQGGGGTMTIFGDNDHFHFSGVIFLQRYDKITKKHGYFCYRLGVAHISMLKALEIRNFSF